MYAENHAGVGNHDLSAMTIAVTGATSGIGREAALGFGRLGARVLLIGRDATKAAALVDRFQGLSGAADAFTADFTELEAVDDLIADIQSQIDELDILVNNAGSIFRTETFTPDGFEKTIAVNYLAAYRLTHGLSEELTNSDDPHVVNVSSNGHRFASLDIDKFEHPHDYGAFEAYNRSKLALLCFSNELARRSDVIRSNSLHPGFVPDSGFYRRFPRVFQKFLPLLHYIPRVIIRRPIVTTAEGGGAIMHTALQDTTGKYYEEQQPVEPSDVAQDQSQTAELWEFTADRLDIDPTWQE